MTPSEQHAFFEEANRQVPFIIDLLAFWEAMDAACATDGTGVASLIELRDNVGVAECRVLCVSLHPYADKVWKAYEAIYGEDSFGGAFDWEFLPLLVRQIDWTKAGYDHDVGHHLTVADLPAPRDMARKIQAAQNGGELEEIDLGQRIRNALDTDEDGIDGARIVRAYASADVAGKKLIDDVMTSLCGWSVETLLKTDPPE